MRSIQSRFYFIFILLLATPWTHAQNAAAAKKAAETSPECKALGAFYWEIGDRSKVLVSGSRVGVNDGTRYNIASATKWVFAAYAVQTDLNKKKMLMASTIQSLGMRTGYNSYESGKCLLSTTVQKCFDAGDNKKLTSSAIGKFYYSGGPFQQWAVANGMGSMNNSDLQKTFESTLGKHNYNFSSPQMAAGMNMAAKDYRLFLMKLLNNQLLTGLLGSYKQCTLPGVCKTALFSPTSYPWSYSLGHWVEEGRSVDDGALSSPGAFGFYPWINKSKTHYGIISRHKIAATAADESAQCGRQIRKAYFGI